MNPYAVVILAALLLNFALETTAELLNLRALDPQVPAEFRDVFDPERYRRSQEYTRARTRLGLVAAATDLALVLAYWFAGGFNTLERALKSLGLGAVPTGLLFVGTLVLGRVIVGLPLRWWGTFVLEERFGFNRTTPRTFWTDLLKGLVLAGSLGGPLLAVILWLFNAAGTGAWLWCWLATALAVLGIQLLAPTWIFPLFNTFTPLPAGELRDAILSYGTSVRFPLEDVFVIDGSRRSTKANAFFTGFGRHKRVALFDTLVATLDSGELLAVVAHEIGHYKRRHVLTGMIVTILQAGMALFLLSLVLDSRGLFDAFGMDTRPVYAGLVFFALLFTPIDLALSVLLHAYSRHNEFEADAFAVRTTGAAEPLARSLKRLSADSLANLTPHPLHVLLHASHPPLLERIRVLRSAAATVR